MEYVVWSEMFSTRVPYIDNQHKKLLDIVNEFHGALKEKMGEDILFQILNSLIRYAEEHFRDEETVMDMTGYPADEALSHRKLHEELVEEIFALNENLKGPEKKSLQDIEVFLNGWLIRHILIQDKKLASYAGHLKAPGSPEAGTATGLQPVNRLPHES